MILSELSENVLVEKIMTCDEIISAALRRERDIDVGITINGHRTQPNFHLAKHRKLAMSVVQLAFDLLAESKRRGTDRDGEISEETLYIVRNNCDLELFDCAKVKAKMRERNKREGLHFRGYECVILDEWRIACGKVKKNPVCGSGARKILPFPEFQNL